MLLMWILIFAITVFFFLQKIRYNYVCLLITMHSQVRELARHIAREEFQNFPTRNPLRLSSSTDMEMLRSQVCVFGHVLFYLLLLKRWSFSLALNVIVRPDEPSRYAESGLGKMRIAGYGTITIGKLGWKVCVFW